MPENLNRKGDWEWAPSEHLVTNFKPSPVSDAAGTHPLSSIVPQATVRLVQIFEGTTETNEFLTVDSNKTRTTTYTNLKFGTNSVACAPWICSPCLFRIRKRWSTGGLYLDPYFLQTNLYCCDT